MNANKELWEKGDFTRIAQSMRESGEKLVKKLGVTEGLRLLDLGCGDGKVERFTQAGVAEEAISFERDTYTFNYPGPPSELLAEFRTYYGPTMNAFGAAAANGREAELEAELEALFNEQNTSDDATSIPATFLRVTVER